MCLEFVDIRTRCIHASIHTNHLHERKHVIEYNIHGALAHCF